MFSAADEILIAIPALLVGGTELHTLALARTLQSAGARVRVCCYYEHTPAMVMALEELGVEVRLLRLERAMGLWHLMRVLHDLFIRLHPSAVHVQHLAPGLIPIVAAKAARIRTVFATVHQPGDCFGMREHLLFSLAARLCTAFFCVSQAVERSWFGNSAVFSTQAAALGRQHFTIYNGVDANRTNEKSAHIDCGAVKANLGLVGRRVIGVVARLRVEKGHASIINALPLVMKAVPDVALLVVGDGPDGAGLVEQARSLGVLQQIVWTGQRSPEEALDLFTAMDVVVVPSQFEGFGLSAAEAMAAGRPVVGTRVGGLAEIIEDGVTGYLIAPGDETALADALIRVLGDPVAAATMGARGRIRVCEHFSNERFSETFVDAYRYFMNRTAFAKGAADRIPVARR